MTRRAMESIDGVLQARRHRPLHARPHVQGTGREPLRAGPGGPLPPPAGHARPGRARRLWHAIIRRNYGVTHFIVGRDHASPGPFYGTYDAQELVARHQDEVGVTMIPFKEVTAANGQTISGTQVREEYLAKGKPLPEWFTRPEVAAILAEAHPPRHREGFCVWFTGLSGAGKSTTAEIVVTLLLEHGRQSTLLDGDVVRTPLSKGLGFSKEDRDANILRIGFVAADCPPRGHRRLCRGEPVPRHARQRPGDGRRAPLLRSLPRTPIEVCEQRDVKGMYAQARAGLVKNFTGADDPYEPPVAPEITLDTVSARPGDNAREIIAILRSRGFLRG